MGLDKYCVGVGIGWVDVDVDEEVYVEVV